MINNLRLRSILGDFQIEDHSIDYPSFMARFYNFCLANGMEAGKIVPSRAFCSDESQGLPIIQISKHFGAFPFDHGLVGGIMAHGRHAAYAHHGRDLVIIQASHVGYEPLSQSFGRYRRLQTEDQHFSSNCGKIHHTLEWYLNEYEFACTNLLLQKANGRCLITIDKQLISQEYEEGLYLELDKMIETDKDSGNLVKPIKILSTSHIYPASRGFIQYLQDNHFNFNKNQSTEIGEHLIPSLFYFKRNVDQNDQIELNLYEYLPWIVTSGKPMLSAAEINVQIEFDRAYRSIVREESYHHRNLIYIAGLNIDYSPTPGQCFSLSQFVPWAAYVQQQNSSHRILEQDALYKALMNCSDINSEQIKLDSRMW